MENFKPLIEKINRSTVEYCSMDDDVGKKGK